MADTYDKPGNQQTLPSSDDTGAAQAGQRASDDQSIAHLEEMYGKPAVEDQDRNAGKDGYAKGNFDNAARDELGALPNLNAISSSPGSRGQRAKQVFFGSTTRKIATGFGITGVVGGSIFSLFFMLLPATKLPAFLDASQRIFSGNMNMIGDTMTQRMISQYLSQKVIPGMTIEGCETTSLNKSCARASEDSTYVGKLFNAWKDSRFENKLYTNYGFEIRREGRQIFIRSDKLQQDIFRGDYTPDNQAEFDRRIYTALYDNPNSRNEVRKVVNDAVQGETKWKTWIMRQQVASLVNRKYGIPRCNVACGGRDKAQYWAANNAVVDKSRAIRGFAVQKIAGPRSEGTALAIECAIDSFSCLEATTEDNGVKRTKYQTDLRARAAEFAAAHDATTFKKMLDDSESMRKNGLANHMVSKLFGKTGELGAKIGAKLIPGVGWADTIISLIAGGSQIGLYYATIYYSLHATDAIGTLTMFSVAQDEFESGDMDAVTYASFASALDASPDTINDGLGAESSRTYKAFTETPEVTAASLTGTAYAAESEQCSTKDITTAVTDDEGNTVDYGPSEITKENGTIMCANESFLAPPGMLADVTSGISEVFNFVPGLADVAKTIVQWQSALTGWIMDATGLQGAIDYVSEAVGTLIPDELMDAITAPLSKVFTRLFPPLVELASSGSRYATAMVHANAQLLAIDAPIEMGGQAVSGEEYAQREVAYQQQEKEQFEQQSVFARMFSTDDSRSLVSQVALALPAGSNASVLAQPTTIASALTSSIASIFSGRSSAASASTYATYFNERGGTPHTIPADDPVLSANYEEYENAQQCSRPELYEQRAATAVLDEKTGQFTYPSTNGCMAIKYMTCSLGKQAVDDFEACDQGEAPTSDTGGSGAGGGALGTSTDMKALAQQVLDNPNITLYAGYGALRQVQNVANGTDTATCHVSPYILNLMLLMAENHSFRITTLNRLCINLCDIGAGDASFHCKDGGGHAIDIDTVDGNSNAGNGTAQELAMLRDIVQSLPSGSQIGQVECRPRGSLNLPSGVTEFSENNCSHLHINLPVYDY
jgi:hypothetical protein